MISVFHGSRTGSIYILSNGNWKVVDINAGEFVCLKGASLEEIQRLEGGLDLLEKKTVSMSVYKKRMKNAGSEK